MAYESLIQNRSVRKQILLTEEDNKKLKIVSEATGLSQNEIINKGLSAYLSRYKKYFNNECVLGDLMAK